MGWPHDWPVYRDDGYLEFALEQSMFPEGPEFANGTSLVDQFRALFSAGDSWFDASRYNVDGVSGKVGSFIDYIDPTHLLSQATSAQQVTIPAANPAFNNSLTASFLGGQWYMSSRPASAWKSLHDGTGGEIVTVFSGASAASTKVIWATRATTSSAVGAYGLLYTGAVRPGGGVGNGVAALVDISAGVLVNVPVCVSWSLNTALADANKYKIRVGATRWDTSTVTNTPSSADPVGFCLAASTSGQLPLDAPWRATYHFNRELTTGERAILLAFVTSETGIV